MSSARRKPEDLAEGCRGLAALDQERAAATPNDQMRARFEASADAWTARAHLLERLETNFTTRAAANVGRSGRGRKAMEIRT